MTNSKKRARARNPIIGDIISANGRKVEVMDLRRAGSLLVFVTIRDMTTNTTETVKGSTWTKAARLERWKLLRACPTTVVDDPE